jgi:outer membrane protein assembly factor BamD (BamD/ComL family)
MGVLGVASSTLFNYLSQNVNLLTNRQQFQQGFQQLGKDLQSGNLSAAQSDITALQQDMPQGSTNASSQTPTGQAFSQLAQDLKSGNLSAAQQDYTTVQHDFQNASSARQAMQGHRHHHGSASNTESTAVNQLFSELGAALQSGNLSGAQQYYSSLQQDLLQFTQGGTASSGSASGSATTATTGVSATA